LLILLAYFAKSPSLAIALLCLGAVFASIGGPCAFAAAIDVGGRQTTYVVAIMNTAGNVAAAVCPMVVGAFFTATPHWDLVLWGFASIYLIAAACWAFVDLEQPAPGNGSATRAD
jgi:ACS family glucarate transporter-like MFS transporter/ACS family D-galactonate transporter-like MFS transporter